MPKHHIKLVQKFEQIIEVDCPGDHIDACVVASKRLMAGELKFELEAANPVGRATIEPTYAEKLEE